MQLLSSSRALRASVALTTLAIASAASAVTLEYDFTVPSTQTTFSSPVSLSKFNPALGTLTGVTFGFKNTMSTQISLSNLSTSSPNSLIGTTNGSFSFKDASNSVLLSDTLVAQAGTGFGSQGPFTARPSSSAPPFTGTYGGVFSPTVIDTGYITKSLTDPATFSAYIGTGSLNYTYGATALGTTTGPNGSSPANFIDDYVTKAASQGYVIYSYAAPVPEPATMAALGLGVLGLARRRKGGRS